MAEEKGSGEEGGGAKNPGVKFSMRVAKVSSGKPPLPTKRKDREEGAVVEYVTSVDAEAGIVVVNPRPGRGGPKVVPKLENSWRPEKRMKNIVMESDAMRATEETFEMETMDAGPKPNVQYGLTLMETRVESEAEVPRRMSLKELEDQKLREDLTSLPEEATLDQYEELPVEEFGEALLRGMGWEKGKPIGRNAKTVVEPVEYTRRQGTLGLGATAPPPKEINKKYIKPGETREKRRDEYVKPRDSRENGKDEYIKPRDARENGRDEYVKPEKSRDNSREEYVKPQNSREYRREDDSRRSRRDELRDSFIEPRDSRGKRREEHRKPKESRESRRDEYSESRDSREKRRDDYSWRDESRREQRRSDRR